MRLRADHLARVRAFFAQRGVLEVETPVLAGATVTDVHIASFETLNTADPGARRLYLQTSPEFAMKRLLAAGSGAIYQVSRAFRIGESGRLHNPEFTLLEWYRPEFDQHALMDEIDALLDGLLGGPPSRRVCYREAFHTHTGLDPWSASLAALRERCRRLGLVAPREPASATQCLDFILARQVQPALGAGRVFVYDFPPAMAALARVRQDAPPVAERFELFVDGVEIANGYHELADASEQRARFDTDCAARRSAAHPEVALDEYLLAALEHGLPDCSGVALGLDRILMLAAGVNSVADVLAFPMGRA